MSIFDEIIDLGKGFVSASTEKQSFIDRQCGKPMQLMHSESFGCPDHEYSAAYRRGYQDGQKSALARTLSKVTDKIDGKK